MKVGKERSEGGIILSMELSLANFLISDVGEMAISEALDLQAKKVETIAGLTFLRRQLNSDQAGIVWKTAQIRRRAVEKLGEIANGLVFDQDGYEMSSGWAASRYHAELLQSTGAASVVDLCAGLGLDSIAFAQAGLHVTAYESDPGRAILLASNIRRCGFSGQVDVINEDVTFAQLPPAESAYFDPARRSGGRRWLSDDENTLPPLSFIRQVEAAGIANVIAKLTPAVDRSVGYSFDGSLQFVSVKGECKEALLMLGKLKDKHGTSAVLLPEGSTFGGGEECPILEKHGAYIWEPDAAVIRAGLTGALAMSLNGWQCDRHNDYFFTDSAGSSPFATCYRVISSAPYSRRTLQESLAGTSKVIFKQRGFPQSIEEVQSKLKLGQGTKESIVILAAFNGAAYTFIVEKMAAPVAGSRPS